MPDVIVEITTSALSTVAHNMIGDALLCQGSTSSFAITDLNIHRRYWAGNSRNR
jgi:hypothetical protein